MSEGEMKVKLSFYQFIYIPAFSYGREVYTTDHRS